MKSPFSTDSQILLAAPVNEYKNYILPEWLSYLETIKGDFDVLLIDNSKNPEYHKTLPTDKFKRKITIRYTDPGTDTAQQFILRSRNMIRNHFLNGGYTHLFSLECDVFPPTDVIERLLKHNKPIVSGWYFIEQKEKSHPLFVMANILTISGVFNLFVCSFTHSFLLITGRLVQTIGNGIGCTLILREVIERIPFRLNPNDNGFDDAFFNQDLWMKGIDHFCDTSLFCEHKNLDWSLVKEFNEIDKKTGEIKKFIPNTMNRQQIESVINECKKIITFLEKHKTTLENIIVILNQEMKKTPGNFADNLIYQKKIYDTTRELWELQVEIKAKICCLESYQQRIL
jgi:hypothetical protein